MAVAREPVQEGPLILTGGDIKKAMEILEEVEKTMALTFKGMGKSDISELMFRANMYFKTLKTDEIQYREFARYFENDADKLTLTRLLDTLEAVGTVQVIHRPQADSIIKVLEVR